MTRRGQQQNTAYIVACGPNLFLGCGTPARTGAIERARQFATLAEAEATAKTLRQRGRAFELPWKAKAVPDHAEVWQG